MREQERTVVIDAFPDSAFRHRRRDAVVCVDVMLATTTLVTAAACGRRTFVAAGPAELRTLAARLGDVLVAGALDGVAGATEVPDGPCAVGRIAGDRRPLVLLSLPGTELITNVAQEKMTHLACFRNLAATAAALAPHRRVAILVAGCRQEFSCEDQMAAAWIAERLLDQGFGAEDRRTVEAVRRWTGISPSLAGWGNSAALLRGAGRSDEVDFVISHVDDLERACFCEGSEVRFGDGPLEVAASGSPLQREKGGGE